MQTLVRAILASLIVLSFCSTSFAEFKVFILETMHVPVVEEHGRLVGQYLQEMAKEQGEPIRIKTYNADGKLMQARTALNDALEDFRPDLVISVATLATQVASKTLKGSKLPHLFCVVADPVGGGIVPADGPDKEHLISGFVYGIDRTAVVNTAARIIGSKPTGKTTRIGILFSTYPSSISDFKGYSREFAEIPEVEVMPQSIPYLDGEGGMKTMLERSAKILKESDHVVDYWWQVRGPLAENQEFHSLFKLTGKPLLFGNNVSSVRHGAIFTISQRSDDTSRELAGRAMQILKGRSITDFPIGYPQGFYSAVNLSSAEKHGLEIPADIIEAAGVNVFHSIE